MVKKTGKHVQNNVKRQKSITKNTVNLNKHIRNTVNNRTTKQKINKKKVAIAVIVVLLIIVANIKKIRNNEAVETVTEKNIGNVAKANELDNKENDVQNQIVKKKKIDDWRLTIANYENLLPEDFTVNVSNIDKTRQFDSRAIDELNTMMNDMKKSGIGNVWIQSAYRSIERQKELYDSSVQKYLKQGKTQEDAERLTSEYINKPGSSDHNLGLAVDFNYVDNKFESLNGFKWLQENAENYGFILRYPKDKESITKIAYESWHWRYVGVEHAKKMNELNLCLEEYVEYLETLDDE